MVICKCLVSLLCNQKQRDMEFNGQSNYFANNGSATQKNEVHYTGPSEEKKEETIFDLLARLITKILRR